MGFSETCSSPTVKEGLSKDNHGAKIGALLDSRATAPGYLRNPDHAAGTSGSARPVSGNTADSSGDQRSVSIHAGMLACSAFDRSISIYLLTLETNHVLTDRRIGNSPRLRIAASSYLNSAPLIWSFLHGSMRGRIDFIEAVPARCADLLSQSQVEAALVPVIEYQRIPAGLLVPDVCVGSKKEVRSVVLVSRHAELHQIRSVALDESSRTSATLVKVIFREFLEHEPSWTTHSPNLPEMLEQNDAALIIGDPGMVFPRTGLKVWDMAQLWRNYTRLGFVFAMWMVRDEAIQDARHIDFAAACNEGLGMKDQIIAQYEKLLGLSRQSLKEYLDENICFRLDDELQSGLELYFQLAHKHGLLSELKPLKTLKP